MHAHAIGTQDHLDSSCTCVFVCVYTQVGSRQEPKKPIVFETYEELVFSEPRLEFYQRMQAHVPSEHDLKHTHTHTHAR